MPFTLEMGRIALAKMDQAVESHREYLTELDSAIGDADHGINMSRGFRKTMEKIQGAEHPDLGALFRDVAMVMMGSVGGASGPLYGTFFMKVSQKLAGKDQVELPQLAEALQEGLNGIVALGKAQVGTRPWWIPWCLPCRPWPRRRRETNGPPGTRRWRRRSRG